MVTIPSDRYKLMNKNKLNFPKAMNYHMTCMDINETVPKKDANSSLLNLHYSLAQSLCNFDALSVE